MQTQDLIAKLETAAVLLEAKNFTQFASYVRQAITHITTQDALLGEAKENLAGLCDAYVSLCKMTGHKFHEGPYGRYAAAQEALARIAAHLRPVDPLPVRGEVYEYKGKTYRVVGDCEDNYLIQFEDEWHPAVEYECLPDVGKTFYRALPDFKAKFRKRGIGKEVG